MQFISVCLIVMFLFQRIGAAGGLPPPALLRRHGSFFYEQLLSSYITINEHMKKVAMKLSEHFSLAEMTRTSVKNASNMPTPEALANLQRLSRWLEMLREEWNKRYGDGDDPIVVNCAYRSPAVNKAVGGVPTSNHLTGCAVDIRAAGPEQASRYATILLDISDESQEPFDELLVERKGHSYWVHFAVKQQGNRRKILFINN